MLGMEHFRNDTDKGKSNYLKNKTVPKSYCPRKNFTLTALGLKSGIRREEI
jgi:hypothetical protein